MGGGETHTGWNLNKKLLWDRVNDDRIKNFGVNYSFKTTFVSQGKAWNDLSIKKKRINKNDMSININPSLWLIFWRDEICCGYATKLDRNFHFSPMHSVPTLRYPSGHWQEKEPSLLKHCWLGWQSWMSCSHSSTSVFVRQNHGNLLWTHLWFGCYLSWSSQFWHWRRHNCGM